MTTTSLELNQRGFKTDDWNNAGHVVASIQGRSVTAGEIITDLLAVTKACERLVKAAATVGNLSHAGLKVDDAAWAELYASHCAASGALADIGH